MVDQIVADSRRVHLALDAQRCEFVARPDPQPHQQSGGMYRAGRQRDATAPHLLRCAGALDFDADRSAVLEDHAMRVDRGANRQIQAMTRGREIADRGRDANAVAPVARPGSDAGGLRIIVVRDLRVS